MTVKRLDNVGIVVEDIDPAIEFFRELGLELEGRAPIEGDGLCPPADAQRWARRPDGAANLQTEP